MTGWKVMSARPFQRPGVQANGAELAGKIQAGFGDNAKVTLYRTGLGGGHCQLCSHRA